MDLATLQHSVFLQALGGAIVSSLWQSFILWFIYETINIFYKTATSAFKTRLGTLLMFIAFAWFISSFISKISFDEKELSALSSSVAASISLQASLNELTWQRILSYAAGMLPYLSVSYIFLLIFLIIKLFSAYRHVYFIANKRLIAPPLRLQDFATKVAIKMTIAKNIRVWLSDHVDVPATIGFIKPVILIPIASVNSLSSDQLEAIILHELSHIKRNDYLINLFISVIETILFFNPFILLLSKAVKRERENCCDDFVIQYRYDPYSYASALLRLEQSRRSNLQLSVAAVSGKKQLLKRIKRITKNNAATTEFNYGQKLFALLVITGIIFSIGWLSPQEKDRRGISQEAKILKKNIGITKVPQNKKEGLVELSNFQTEVKPHKVTEAKDPKSSIDIFQSNDPKPVITRDNAETSFGWKDFENNILKLSDQALQNSRMFDNIQKAKFAPFKAVPNFAFPKLNLNIDVTEINKNLVLAYKEINAMDWSKVQDDINESLSNINVDHLKDAEKKELLEEKARDVELMLLQKRRINYVKDFLSQPGEHFFVNDSSQPATIGGPDRDNLPLQNKYRTGIRTKTHGSGNYDFVYVPKPAATSENTLPHNSGSHKAFTVTGLNSKNIKVIIENIGEAFKDGSASFNFSSSSEKKDSKEKKQKIVSVQINDLP